METQVATQPIIQTPLPQRTGAATLRQAADYLQVSERSIQNYAYQGLLKPIYLGRRRFYKWSELEKLAKHGDR